MKYLPIFGLGLALMVACTYQTPVDEASKLITDDRMMEHISVLSSDEFEGRATGTEGEEKTVDYLVRKFEEYGLEEGMPDGGFTQDIPLVGQKTDPDATLSITRDGETIHEMDYASDFIAWPSNLAEEVTISGAELLYVGYGIQAPEEDWDDFKDADVEGKILVVKNNDPSEESDLFGGETRLYYGRYGYKYEQAREMGAAGVLIVHTTPTAGYGWNVVSNSWGSEQFYLRDDESARNSQTQFNGWLTKESSADLFESAGLNLEEQLDAAESRDFEPVQLKGLRLDIGLQAEYREQDGKNVLATIEGSDPDLRDEYLVFTAHHDHLGITEPVEGDSINNGALDNAAGVSALLNMAEAYKAIEGDLDRSLLFLVVGAEEVGLLGSEYWAENPTVHPGKVTGNINLDGMNVYGPTEDIVLVGYGRNTVSDTIEELAEADGRTVKPDDNPDQGYFYRSDHFPLAKRGIPAIFPNPGSDFIGKPEGYSNTVDSLMEANYHNVNDEVNDYWDLSGMKQDVRLFFEAGYDIANEPEMQTWQEGDEFEAARQEMLEEAEE